MSDFWVRKMKTYFTRIDFDADGSITPRDFEGMADRFVQFEKLSKEKGDDLKKKLLQVIEIEVEFEIVLPTKQSEIYTS